MKSCPRGFTLLEVLIALAIVAIGLTAALRASGVGIEGTLEYRSRFIALWLAENLAAERTARRDWPDPGLVSQEEEMAGHRFIIRQEVKTTPNPRFRRLEIRVASAQAPEHSLRDLVVFLLRPS
jgi:general secretion pathway protein I